MRPAAIAILIDLRAAGLVADLLQIVDQSLTARIDDDLVARRVRW